MIIYYDSKENVWFHTHLNHQYTLGLETDLLSYRKKPSPSSIPFHVHCRGGSNLGPVVAILTGRNHNQSLTGNRTLFKKLQSSIHDFGGIAVVTTPDDLLEHGMRGFVYHSNQKCWIDVLIPNPHIVYNRIPSRRMERSEKFKDTLETIKNRGICFFNPSFLNKYELYTLFKDHQILQAYFPETIEIQDPLPLKEFLDKHISLYIKPSNASKGKGIFKIKLEEDSSITYHSLKKTMHFHEFNAFWNHHQKKFRKKNHIAQREISPLLYNGKRFDFRILSHFNGSEYVVTGIGIRQSGEQNITTHIPTGGKLLDLTEVYRPEDDQFIQKVVKHCGEYLTDKLGFFGEFSIDAGITEDHDYVIYEINSKPMSFDEEDIENNRINQLVLLFKSIFECFSFPDEVQ